MKKRMLSLLNYFTKGELILWLASLTVITVSFFIFDSSDYLSFAASLIGVTSLILNAKGNPIGQFLMVIFGIMYGMISYTFEYYGEMITYMGMTVPMAIVALISWMRNPYDGNKAEVKVNSINKREIIFLIFLTAVVTAGFYFILKVFNTANLIPSTISVTTSFAAVYLTFRRSPYFAVAYAANDIVLIVLWAIATISDMSYLSVTICFAVFLINDIYGFINWLKIQKRQKKDS